MLDTGRKVGGCALFAVVKARKKIKNTELHNQAPNTDSIPKMVLRKL